MGTLTQYFVPQWVAIAFLIAIPLPFVLLTRFVRQEAKRFNHASAYPIVMAFFVFYIAYILLASLNGWFNQVSFPPRVLLFTTFPYAFLLFGWVARTSFYKKIVENTSIEQLVGLHIFRVVGVFFIILALHDALPKGFAFIAGAGDVITAITSVFVAKALANKQQNAKTLTYIWNIFGTVDILFTAIAANVLTKISMNTGAMGVDSLAFFPYCIIPAFAPPTILLLHWTVFQKLKNLKITN